MLARVCALCGCSKAFTISLCRRSASAVQRCQVQQLLCCPPTVAYSAFVEWLRRKYSSKERRVSRQVEF